MPISSVFPLHFIKDETRGIGRSVRILDNAQLAFLVHLVMPDLVFPWILNFVGTCMHLHIYTVPHAKLGVNRC